MPKMPKMRKVPSFCRERRSTFWHFWQWQPPCDSLEDDPSMGLDTDIDESIAEDPPIYEQVHVNQQLPVPEIILLEPAVVQKPVVIEPAPAEIPAVPMAIIDEEDDDLIEYIDQDSIDNESRIDDSESSEDEH